MSARRPKPKGKPRGRNGGRPAVMLDGVRIDLRVPGALLARVDAIADRDGVERSSVVRAALELYAPSSSGRDHASHGAGVGHSSA